MLAGVLVVVGVRGHKVSGRRGSGGGQVTAFTFWLLPMVEKKREE
jgi:hypothetical protein